MSKLNTTPSTRSNTFAVNLSVTKKVDTLLLSDDLAVVKVTYSHQSSPAWPAQLPALFQLSDCLQVLCTREALQQFEAGETLTPAKHPKLSLVTPEFISAAAHSSYDDAMQLLHDDKQGLRDRVFDAFEQGKASVDQLVHIEWGSHLLFDRHGDPLPVVQHLSYLRGMFDNTRYDLDKALKVLRAHPRVSARSRGKQVELAIQAIPYYNADGGRTHQLEFAWTPTATEMKQLLEENKRLNPKYPGAELPHALFTLDLLGLRKAGAAKYEDYWQGDE